MSRDHAATLLYRLQSDAGDKPGVLFLLSLTEAPEKFPITYALRVLLSAIGVASIYGSTSASGFLINAAIIDDCWFSNKPLDLYERL